MNCQAYEMVFFFSSSLYPSLISFGCVYVRAYDANETKTKLNRSKSASTNKCSAAFNYSHPSSAILRVLCHFISFCQVIKIFLR